MFHRICEVFRVSRVQHFGFRLRTQDLGLKTTGMYRDWRLRAHN